MKKTKILDAIIVFIIAIIILSIVNAVLFLTLGVSGMAISELLIVIVPLGVVILRKEDLSERFNLKVPNTMGSFFAAAVMMMGVNMWENASTYAYVGVFGMSEQSDLTFLNSFFSGVSPIMALIIIALIPAICEELLFRGYLLDSLKGKKSGVAAVIITSILFSLLHFDYTSLNFYKLIPLLIMALAFGYITLKTDSVLIPMIFHFINNANALISYYTLKSQGVTTEEVSVAADPVYLWYALAGFGAGLGLIYFGTRFLSGKPRKWWLNLIVVLLSLIILATGVIGGAMSMTNVSYEGEYTSKLREDTVETESFTVEEDSVGVIYAGVLCARGVEGSVTVTDREGKEIYTTDQSGIGMYIEMPKGEYTVTYSFDLPDGQSVSYDVEAFVMVFTIDPAVT
ncbi:MAG: CPBP family intramembrane metalloprotease [Clostridia bacterium]|nr:CPBP family intramembrane metalloprotease [Clostridia bacterium]